jgi:hypothetical protein
MKGVPGLLIAVALAITGALCNWFYMAQKSRELDVVEFIGIAPGGMKAGDLFQPEKLIRVPVPELYARRLKESAPIYGDVSTVIGTPAYRDFQDGEVILRQDLETPPGNSLKRDLGPNDLVIWVTVDNRGFVPTFLSGGDEVSFIVPKIGAAEATPVSIAGNRVAANTEVIGPFYVLALGNRRGSSDRSKAAGFSQTQENVLAIRVTRINETELEPKAQLLLDHLRLSNNQALGIIMHSDKKAKK